MIETDEYGKFIFPDEHLDRDFVETPTGINWSERIKQRQEEYATEQQYQEDIEEDKVGDVKIEVELLPESFLKLMEDYRHIKFVTIDEHPKWKQAMRRLGRL